METHLFQLLGRMTHTKPNTADPNSGIPKLADSKSGDVKPGDAKLEAAIGAEIRKLRKRMDMTIAMLAESTGLSQGMLSKIETGQTSPSLSTLERIADALGTPLSSFFSATERSRDVSFVPAGSGISIDRRGTRAGHLYQLLGHSVRGGVQVEPYMITLDEGSETYDAFRHEGMEFIHVLSGRLVYRHGEQRFPLGPGDSLLFDALAPHGPAELIELPAVYLSIISSGPRDGD